MSLESERGGSGRHGAVLWEGRTNCIREEKDEEQFVQKLLDPKPYSDSMIRNWRFSVLIVMVNPPLRKSD